MIDAVYRGNIEELLSVFNHLKRYIIAFAVVLLVLISVFHFSKYSVHVVPLITVALILLPTAYYSVVLVVKFIDILVASDQTGEATTMDANGNREGLKTPEVPYPKSPTPPPSYEEATRNDHYDHQPQSWLPSTSSGCGAPMGLQPVFNVERQFNVATAAAIPQHQAAIGKDEHAPSNRTVATIQNIPSVTITLDSDQQSMEI